MKKGGNRAGAGRKPKATEIELIELLSPLDAIAFKALEKGVQAGEFPYIKLFMEYRYGKPKQMVEVISEAETVLPIINVVIHKSDIPLASSESEVDMKRND